MHLSCVDYCDVFISCLNTYSDGTHSLQSKQLIETLQYSTSTVIHMTPVHQLIFTYPFTVEDPLVSEWCNDTFLHICSNK